MRRALAHLRDLAALFVLGVVWLVTGAWRSIPRHDEDLCEDCWRGRCDRTSVVI